MKPVLEDLFMGPGTSPSFSQGRRKAIQGYRVEVP
jgi:hypothetical protein